MLLAVCLPLLLPPAAAAQEAGAEAAVGFAGSAPLENPVGFRVRAATLPVPFLGLLAGYTRLADSEVERRRLCPGLTPSPEVCPPEAAHRSARLHALEAGAFFTVKAGRATWLEAGGGVSQNWASAEVRGRASGRRFGAEVDARWGGTLSAALARAGLWGTPLLGRAAVTYRTAALEERAVDAAFAPFRDDLELVELSVGLHYAW